MPANDHIGAHLGPPKHDPRDYCCLCARCAQERAQAMALAQARQRGPDDNDFAGQLSGAMQLTQRSYRR